MIRGALFIVVAAFLYQVFALPLYTFEGIGPDFVLAAVCALAVHGRPGVALVAAVTCGVIFDFASLDPWSSHAIGYLAASWTLARARSRRWLADAVSLPVLIFFACLLATVVRYSILFIDQGRAVLPTWSGGLLEALYCGVIAWITSGLAAPFRDALAGPRRRSEFHQVLTD